MIDYKPIKPGVSGIGEGLPTLFSKKNSLEKREIQENSEKFGKLRENMEILQKIRKN
jgi:hypothetical protein